MRTIKFRAKAKGSPLIQDGTFVYGSLVLRNENMPVIDIYGYVDGCGVHYKHTVDKDTIGQFTGLYDKSGKEIYEGDIMGLPKCDAVGIEYKNRYVRVVEWINDGFFLVEHCEMGGELRKYGDRLALEISLKSRYAGIARCFKERGLDYTVIGNIHDNPDLLKGGER